MRNTAWFVLIALMCGSATANAQDYSSFCNGDVSLEEALARGQQAAQAGHDAESKCWLRKAGEQADPSVKFKVAMMYKKGNGGFPRDPAEVEYWLKWAASEGFSTAKGYLVCSTAEGREAMLDLARRCWATPTKIALRSPILLHCNEDQILDDVQDVDVIMRANDPSIFRCKLLMTAHIVELSERDTPKPLECSLADASPAARSAAAVFDLVDNGNGGYTLVIHDPDEDSTGACNNMSADFRTPPVQ
jgi:hypothetical protein